MKATVSLLLLLLLLSVVTLGTCRTGGFKGTRTYNLETDEDRYGRYERVLLGLKTSEGLRLDPALLDEVRQVLLQEERQAASGREVEPVDVHLYKPLQSRHIAQLLYRARLDAVSGSNRRTR
ncbi:uncharacterized protein LOC120895883 [Anopheles arabiensis]|uniref:Uncharacterized protein n=1 Tax=Anopheles arabiensis TaxID=7173 RepID=A0A182I4S1_ANOAR|nr:uncharacterized protein LOC120895883 [Anopheles arabiensis]XP_061507377.1 uncharacterized protein LOC133392182 [Anopheles gambiae]